MTPARTAPDIAGPPSNLTRLPARVAPLSPQRDLMRRLFRTLGDDREIVCQAYAEAERDGKVERTRGAEGMTPRIHAGTLWWEGKLRGWLRA